MNINVATQVNVNPVTNLQDLVSTSAAVANLEGGNLMRHAVKLGTASGDLVSNVSQVDGVAISTSDVADEVAEVIIRAVNVGSGFGVTASELQVALARTAETLMRDGLAGRIGRTVKGSGFFLNVEQEVVQEASEGVSSKEVGCAH